MRYGFEKYSQLSDQELIDRLTATPVEEKLHSYFFTKKCHQFLKYISSNIYNCDNENLLWGEFYEFLSNDNWAILRKWQNKNGASLYTYLAYCTTNYFLRKRNAEIKMQERFIITSSNEAYENLPVLIDDEEEEDIERIPVLEAFEELNQRDQAVLRMLIIDDKSTLEAAPVLWNFIKHSKPLSEMNPKRVQCTIAMAKYRAQLTLLNKLKQVSKGI